MAPILKDGGMIGGSDPDPTDEQSDSFGVEHAEELDLNLPPQMMGAPSYFQFLFIEQKRDRHAARNRDMILDRRLFKLERMVSAMDSKLGEESPDGQGGTGFIGEIRHTTKDVENLKNERNFIRGAIAAITAAGMFIAYGFTAWIKSITGNHA